MKNKFAIPDSNYKTVGIAVKARRLKANISQGALAERAGMHRTYLSVIEREAFNMSMKMFFELAHALEVGPTELLIEAASLQKSVKKQKAQKTFNTQIKRQKESKARKAASNSK